MVVSSSSKWTGAIDHTVTTDYFLHALDTGGREIWKRRFDPKDVATLEAVFTRVMGRPVVLLSASRRLFCFDVSGRQLWEVPLWHHPGTVTATDLDGGTILAAAAPKHEIVRIGPDGTVLGPWGKGDAPRRFRAIQTRSGVYGISVRQVFGRGPGVRQSLAFFDGEGAVIREVELPADAALLTYAPIAAMDVKGSGHRNWVVALGDGTILVYSPLEASDSPGTSQGRASERCWRCRNPKVLTSWLLPRTEGLRRGVRFSAGCSRRADPAVPDQDGHQLPVFPSRT